MSTPALVRNNDTLRPAVMPPFAMVSATEDSSWSMPWVITTTRLRWLVMVGCSLGTRIAQCVRSYERMKVHDVIRITEHELRAPYYVPRPRRLTSFPQDGGAAPYLSVGGFSADQLAGGGAWRPLGRANRSADVPDACGEDSRRRG